MGIYLAKRLLLILPTLIGILVINFTIVQFAPGGPVEQVLAQVSGLAGSTTGAVSSAGTSPVSAVGYTAGAGLDPELIKRIEAQFGFDKPAHERFWIMLTDYAQLDLGDSYFQDRPVIDLILERLPVSLSLIL